MKTNDQSNSYMYVDQSIARYTYKYKYTCIFTYIYIYIYIYINIYAYIYIYIYICNHENNVLSRLSPQCLCGNCAQVHELPQSHCGYNREDTVFS